MFALAAPARVDAFGNEVPDLLQRLIPHLQRAVQMTLKMANLDALRSAGFEALDCLSEGVVLADSTARVVFANRVAEAMLARAEGIGVEDFRALRGGFGANHCPASPYRAECSSRGTPPRPAVHCSWSAPPGGVHYQ